MASIADREAAHGSGPSLAAFIDRWIYVFMAGLFILTVFVGFIPDSIGKIAAINAGVLPPFPPVLHVHAVLMGSWLTLLLAQTVLMATGRKGLHVQLGMASTVLAPAMVLTGFFLVPAMFAQHWAMLAAAPPGTDPIEWLPTTYPESVFSPLAYTVLWMSPMLLWDLYRRKPLLKAYVIWFALFIPASALVMNLWWNDTWIATVQKLMGVA